MINNYTYQEIQKEWYGEEENEVLSTLYKYRVNEKPYMTLQQAADKLGCSVSTLSASLNGFVKNSKYKVKII